MDTIKTVLLKTQNTFLQYWLTSIVILKILNTLHKSYEYRVQEKNSFYCINFKPNIFCSE